MNAIVVDELTPAQKLELISALCESLEARDAPLTKTQIEELDRRLDVEPPPGTPWPEAEARLRRRLS